MVSFEVTCGSPCTVGTYEGSRVRDEKGHRDTPSSFTDTMRSESLRDLSRIVQLMKDRNRSGLESLKSGR